MAERVKKETVLQAVSDLAAIVTMTVLRTGALWLCWNWVAADLDLWTLSVKGAFAMLVVARTLVPITRAS